MLRKSTKKKYQEKVLSKSIHVQGRGIKVKVKLNVKAKAKVPDLVKEISRLYKKWYVYIELLQKKVKRALNVRTSTPLVYMHVHICIKSNVKV